MPFMYLILVLSWFVHFRFQSQQFSLHRVSICILTRKPLSCLFSWTCFKTQHCWNSRRAQWPLLMAVIRGPSGHGVVVDQSCGLYKNHVIPQWLRIHCRYRWKLSKLFHLARDTGCRTGSYCIFFNTCVCSCSTASFRLLVLNSTDTFSSAGISNYFFTHNNIIKINRQFFGCRSQLRTFFS